MKDKLKLVVLIKANSPQIWFVNEIHKKFPISLVVIEENLSIFSAGFNRIKSFNFRNLVSSIKNIMYNNKKITNSRLSAQKILGTGFEIINPSIPLLHVKDINCLKVKSKLSDISPDVVLDHGTSLLDISIIRTTKLCLNLHWGLSPYYRGGPSTEWALLAGDLNNIGVTIHRLDSSIDGGDIYGQERVSINSDDNLSSINLKLTKAGTGIILDALNRISKKEKLKFAKQDFSKGVLVTSKMWTPDFKNKLAKLEKIGFGSIMDAKNLQLHHPIVYPNSAIFSSKDNNI